jgi:hypothetical protein
MVRVMLQGIGHYTHIPGLLYVKESWKWVFL